METMPFRVVERKPGARVLAGAGEFSIPDACRPRGMMSFQQQLGVAGPLGGLDHFAQILEPQAHVVASALRPDRDPQPPGCGKPVAIVAEPLSQFGGALIAGR